MRRNDVYYIIMAISILLHLVLHSKIKIHQIKIEKSLVNSISIIAHQKEAFALRVDKTSASNFATSSIVFGTFILSNQVVIHINTMPASELKEYPHYLSVYWYYLALFSINTLSIVIWYFTRVPKLRKTIFRELKSLLRISDF